MIEGERRSWLAVVIPAGETPELRIPAMKLQCLAGSGIT
jgi:hypothetical protein